MEKDKFMSDYLENLGNVSDYFSKVIDDVTGSSSARSSVKIAN